MPQTTHSALIIDDDPHLRTLVSAILGKVNVTVHQAESVVQSIELVAKHHPKLVLCDLNMPEDSGFIFLDMRDTHPYLKVLPVIIVTARKDKEAFERATSYPNTECLIKPLNPEELIAKVKRIIGE